MSAFIGAARTAYRYRRQIVRALNIQDEWLKSAWMTSPARNIFGRGGGLGARHGVPAGQIIGGILNLGVPSTNPQDGVQKKQRQTDYQQSKKYSSRTAKYRRKYNRCIRTRPRYRTYARSRGY